MEPTDASDDQGIQGLSIFNCSATNTIKLLCNKYNSSAVQQIQFNRGATNTIQSLFFGVLSSSQASTATLISSRIFPKAAPICETQVKMLQSTSQNVNMQNTSQKSIYCKTQVRMPICKTQVKPFLLNPLSKRSF